MWSTNQETKYMEVCPYFLHDIITALRLQVDCDDFLWENLELVFLVKSGHKMGFFVKSNNRLMHGIFLIFCMKLQQHRGWKLVKIMFRKFLLWGFWDKKVPKLPRKRFFKFYTEKKAWYVFNFFHEMAVNIYLFFFAFSVFWIKTVIISHELKLFFLVLILFKYVLKLIILL